MLLQDKIVVISGASSGIGAATARIFARHKAHVVLLARTETALKTVAQQIGNASYYPVDLSHFEAVKEVTEKIKKEIGTPDVLFNNAGIGKWLSMEETEWGEMEQMMAAPYFAAFNLTKGFLPEMLHAKKGHIINITSYAGFIPFKDSIAYSTARCAMRGFSKALAQDLYGSGIKVSLVIPPKVNTEYFEHNAVPEEHFPKLARLSPAFFTVSPQKVGDRIVNIALKGKEGEIFFPLHFKIAQGGLRCLPSGLVRYFL
jgi:short-subunit dehydrogenase